MSPDKQTAHFDRLKSMYTAAPINSIYKSSISICRGGCRIEMDVSKQFHHSGQTVHGSVYFKMLDDAAFFAANSLSKDVLLATSQFSLHFIRAVAEGIISATGEVIQRGKLLTVAKSSLFDHRGRLVAAGSGSFVPTKTALTDAVGYTEENV